jgi:methionine synthase II (cobalamin-independent)
MGEITLTIGTDCGLGDRVHPQIAWAKLRALRDDRKQEVVEMNQSTCAG